MFLSKVDFSSFTCSEKRNSPSLISYWKGKKKDLQLINNENNYLKPHYSHFCLFRWNAFVPFILHIMFSNWFKRTITKQWCPPKKTKKKQVVRCFHLQSDQTIFLLDNRKLFFDPVLDSTAAVAPAPVLAPPLRDTVLLPQPTDLQTAGKIIHNMVKSCQESRFRRQHRSVTDQRVTPEEYMVELLFAAPSCTQIHVCAPYIASDVVSLFSSKRTTPSIRAETTLHVFFLKKRRWSERADSFWVIKVIRLEDSQAKLQEIQHMPPPSSSCHLSVDPPEGWLPWRCRLFLSIIGSATQGRGLGVFLPPPGVCLRICLCTPFDLDRSGKHERHRILGKTSFRVCAVGWLLVLTMV